KISSFEYSLFWGVSLIIYPLFIIYIRKKTNSTWIAFATFLLMGFFTISMNILKQQIAMIIILFAYEYLSEKKYLRFLVLVLLAGSFHITSLFAGIMLIISRFIKPTYKNLMISIFIGIVGYFSYKYLLTQFFTYSSIFSEYEKYLYLQDSYLD